MKYSLNSSWEEILSDLIADADLNCVDEQVVRDSVPDGSSEIEIAKQETENVSEDLRDYGKSVGSEVNEIETLLESCEDEDEGEFTASEETIKRMRGIMNSLDGL